MPHVVIEGPISLDDVWLMYKPLQYSEGGVVIKTEGCYISPDKSELLVRTLVVERGFTKKFFTRLYLHEGCVTIKLEPLTDPDKSDGVKRALGLMCARLLEAFPEGRIKTTNIEPFLKSA